MDGLGGRVREAFEGVFLVRCWCPWWEGDWALRGRHEGVPSLLQIELLYQVLHLLIKESAVRTVDGKGYVCERHVREDSGALLAARVAMMKGLLHAVYLLVL